MTKESMKRERTASSSSKYATSIVSAKAHIFGCRLAREPEGGRDGQLRTRCVGLSKPRGKEVPARYHRQRWSGQGNTPRKALKADGNSENGFEIRRGKRNEAKQVKSSFSSQNEGGANKKKTLRIR
ncbi:hypothetical protein VTK73DRAFT_9826 [Phialemonium thermophilum]|uniref:Uncharacterized protein n=1 Tax=Phialemonium thermophilum TaxID=223376 RepID=A0ABR3W032_9PEZI